MKKIVVPTDFTSVSDVAIKYACELANLIQSEVLIFHIVKHGSEIAASDEKLAEQAANHKAKFGHTISWNSIVGNIFDDIPKVALEEEAELVVMGTHGLRGMQFIVGSNALRVISECTRPMIIVQESTTQSAKVDRLLVPLDLHKDTKQKLRIAGDVAERFKAEVHIISPKENDEFLKNRLVRNVAAAEGYFEDRNITYKSAVTEAGSGGFVKELLSYAKYTDIDMICVLNNAEDQLIHAFGMDSEQKIITNEHGIPVMIMNPMVASVDDRSIFAQ
jgi:nucleotide-binding universal stress UspA family protein